MVDFLAQIFTRFCKTTATASLSLATEPKHMENESLKELRKFSSTSQKKRCWYDFQIDTQRSITN